MDVSIVIPAYNEAERIRATLDQLREYFTRSKTSAEILVVDDGSEDGTADLVSSWAKELAPGDRLEARVLTIPHQGKGAAVAAGMRAAAGRWTLMTDADLSTPISEWTKMERALEAGARVVVGSRQIEGSLIEEAQPWMRQRLGLLFGRLVRKLFPVDVIDSQCGFKAFEGAAAKDLFKEVHASGYCFDVEIILLARARGYKVVETPVRWRNHPDSKVRVLRDWPRVLLELISIRRRLAGKLDGGDSGEGRR